MIKANGSKNHVEKPKMQFVYILLGSCYLREEKLQMIKIFTTCVKFFLKITPIFSGKSVPTQEKFPYPKAEGWKRKQYFLSTSASCQKGLLPAENIKGSSVEINVNELSLPN